MFEGKVYYYFGSIVLTKDETSDTGTIYRVYRNGVKSYVGHSYGQASYYYQKAIEEVYN